MSVHKEERHYEVVVVGGGMAGVCAAIASARKGVKTAIVQNRSMFGGNASSEIRMHIVGANAHGSKKNLGETGILLEILLENKRRNPYASFPVFDSVIWEKVHFQENLDAYLNTDMDDVIMDGKKVAAIIGHQNTTETEFTIYGDIFVDATGHGTLATMGGATGRMGSEGRDEFHEPDAPEEPNDDTMGNTLMFSAVDRGEPVKFIRPDWAYQYTEEDLKYREHGNSIGSHMEGGQLTKFEEGSGRLPHFSNVDSGYWWIELGGQYDDIIRDGEVIRDELLKCVYGVWDHLKNVGDHGVENLDLDWVGIVPGYRESRRIEGDYLLNENDVLENRIFPDAVAYGGWQMDQHVRGGVAGQRAGDLGGGIGVAAGIGGDDLHIGVLGVKVVYDGQERFAAGAAQRVPYFQCGFFRQSGSAQGPKHSQSQYQGEELSQFLHVCFLRELVIFYSKMLL